MSIDLKLKITTTSAEDTERLGRKIGKLLKGGEVIQLVSDLGGGKTTLTRGIAFGAHSKDTVSSPTFTISKQYKCEKFAITHFDFYRLLEAGIIHHELDEAVMDENEVVIIEWADIVSDALPKDRIIINIEPVEEAKRQFIITIPKKYNYLREAIK